MIYRQALRTLSALRNSSTALQGTLHKLYHEKVSSVQQRVIVPSLCSSFHTIILRCQKASLINIQDEEDFKQRVLESDTPVVVDFHADWCGPCKLLGPRLESLIGAENKDASDNKVILAKVDIDEMPDIAMEYGVEAIPTVVAMKKGKVSNKFVGLKDDDEIKSFIAKLIG